MSVDAVPSTGGTNEGERVGIDQHKALIASSDLNPVRGQYRKPAPGKVAFRPAKLVHNIVLGMPSPTPPDKVLAAARLSAEKQFARHRYAMVLHTDQRHPHVHLVVRAEDDLGKRLHIDKPLLRVWREDFPATLRAQGVAANATSRFVRGQTKKAERTRSYRAARHRRSERFDERLRSVATEMNETRTIRDPARPKLVETRRQLLSDWEAAAHILATQGELELAGEVRAFARRLPAVRTDRERLGESFLLFIEAARARKQSRPHECARERTRDDGLTRQRRRTQRATVLPPMGTTLPRPCSSSTRSAAPWERASRRSR
jgi:hypothetical protein